MSFIYQQEFHHISERISSHTSTSESQYYIIVGILVKNKEDRVREVDKNEIFLIAT